MLHGPSAHVSLGSGGPPVPVACWQDSWATGPGRPVPASLSCQCSGAQATSFPDPSPFQLPRHLGLAEPQVQPQELSCVGLKHAQSRLSRTRPAQGEIRPENNLYPFPRLPKVSRLVTNRRHGSHLLFYFGTWQVTSLKQSLQEGSTPRMFWTHSLLSGRPRLVRPQGEAPYPTGCLQRTCPRVPSRCPRATRVCFCGRVRGLTRGLTCLSPARRCQALTGKALKATHTTRAWLTCLLPSLPSSLLPLSFLLSFSLSLDQSNRYVSVTQTVAE